MNEILDFVKAMAYPDRLRIIGLLSQNSATRAELAACLKLSLREITDHLTDLEQVGVISLNGEAYNINDERIVTLAREKLASECSTYVPAEELDEKSQKVLKSYLNPDGSIKQVPLQPLKLKVILNYLIASFKLNANYTEKEVNTILRHFNEDTAGLRRDLVDAGLLNCESDCSRYWRVA